MKAKISKSASKAGTKALAPAAELDQQFDGGQDISAHLDLASAKRPGIVPKRVNVDFPAWMVESLDREAARLGVTRQSVIKVWVAEKLSVNTTTLAS